MAESPCRVDQLSFRWPDGSLALSHCSLTVPGPGLWMLVGDNGSGKSTLLRLIAGVLSPAGGQIHCPSPPALVFQNPDHQLLLPGCGSELLFHLPEGDDPGAPAQRQAVQTTLARVGLAGYAGRPIHSLSGGQKQRLAIASALISEPRLLLLDEPTNHLDLETREALTEALAQFEGTLVVVSHDRHLLRATTDQFIIVADGKLQPFDGDLDDYKDWLFQTKLGKGTDVLPAAGKDNKTDFPVQSPVAPAKADPAAVTVNSKEQKRKDAEERQRLSALRKPIEQKIKRLDEQIAKRTAQKADVDAKLGEESIYDAANKAKLKQLLADQTFFTKDLGELEEQWLALNEQLEALA